MVINLWKIPNLELFELSSLKAIGPLIFQKSQFFHLIFHLIDTIVGYYKSTFSQHFLNKYFLIYFYLLCYLYLAALILCAECEFFSNCSKQGLF